MSEGRFHNECLTLIDVFTDGEQLLLAYKPSIIVPLLNQTFLR